MNENVLRILKSGPWQWRVNVQDKRVELLGARSDIVMDFKRWGTGCATPRFHHTDGLMYDARHMVKPIPGEEHHTGWKQAIDQPFAQAIEEVPDMLLALELIAAGLARIEPATREFCFDGMRYCMGSEADWKLIFDIIGRAKAIDLLAAATAYCPSNGL